MSKFTDDELDLKFLDGRSWELRTELRFYQTEDIGSEIVVPVGFVTDFGSVPRIFWNLIDPYGKPAKAYIVHDFLYRVGHPKPPKNRFTRAQSDAILRDAMRVLGVSALERYVVWLGVRLGGWRSFKVTELSK